MRQLVVGCLVGILCLATPANAGGRTWYFGIEGGLEFSGAEAVYSRSDSQGGALLATIGSAISSRIYLEGELGIRSNQFEGSFGNVDAAQLTLMVNAIYEAPLSKEISIDLGVGIGTDFIVLDDGFGSDGDAKVAAQLKLGLNFALSEATAVTLDYRYLKGFGGDYYLAGGGDKSIVNNTVTVGLRFDL